MKQKRGDCVLAFTLGLYSRQEALWKSRMNAVLGNQPRQSHESSTEGTETDDVTALIAVPVDRLRSEVLRLTNERDSLVSRLEDDAAHLEERLQSVRDQCQELAEEVGNIV